MKNTESSAIKTILAGVLAVLGCIGLLLVSSLIPQKSIQKNAELSSAYFSTTPLFEYLIKNQNAVKRDNYADCISTGIAYHFGNSSQEEGSGNPFIRILKAGYTRDEGENVNTGLQRAVETGAPTNVSYSRYWHGGAAVIRLLLPALSVPKMHMVFFFAGIVLNLSLVAFWIFRKEYHLGSAYLVGMIAGKILFAYPCFEYLFVCLIMPVTSFLVYLWFRGFLPGPGRRSGAEKLPFESIFLVTGILTCFFDFLTAETLTFTLPAFVGLVCMENILNKPFTVRGGEEEKITPLKFFLKSGIFWLSGYGGMFVLKWVLAGLFLGKEEMNTALEFVAERTLGDVHATKNLASPVLNFGDRMKGVFLDNLSCLFGIPENVKESSVILILSGVLCGLFILWFFLRKRGGNKDKKQRGNTNQKEKKGNAFFPLYLSLAFVPVLRFLVLSNHSYLHSFFTYRALIVTVVVITYLFIKTTVLDELF